MLAPEADLPGDAFPPAANEPLVPILRLDAGAGDADALATWHQALSNALAADVPHDLLALWLYPSRGGAVLLGPEALAQDDLTVPLPSPQLQPQQLTLLGEIVRDAGYASAVSLPIRFGRRDVGLLLVASLRPDRFRDSELMVLRLAAQRLAPSLGRLARQWNGVPQGPEKIAALLDGVVQATASGSTPRAFAAALGHVLERLVPHDCLELIVAGPGGGRYYRLGEHLGGPLWADPSLVLEASTLDLAGLTDLHGRVLLGDAGREARWPRGYFTALDPSGAELRAVVGAQATGPTRLTAYLLLGSVGPDLYDEADADLLARVAGLIAPHVALLADHAARERDEPAPAPPPLQLFEIGETLALTREPGEATRRVAELAARVLPFDQLHFALRLSEGDRVVLLDPGERRAIPDLASVPVAGTALGEVLAGERPHYFTLHQGEARLIVPLRVAGRVHGALVLTAASPAVLNEAHLGPAQRVADAVAPHLELLRRAAMLPAPFHPGWKREPRR
ncbi:MAG TPA: GAF domain-containing protein [Gemmatimonadales bacterium]|jgi:hypothetical protein